MAVSPARRRLPATVIALGAVSLLTDLSSEMIYPLLPAFLVSLGAGGAFVGLIEGIADTTASLFKLASGVWSDRLRRRKPLVVAGYGLASTVRPLVALAAAPWQVLLVRFADRIGKGIRSSPRDALIAHAVPAERRGAAYGLHRAMDHTGALLGPLVVAAAMAWWGASVRTVFALAAIPAAAAMIVVVLGVRESRGAESLEPAARTPGATGSASSELPAPPLSGSVLPRELLLYLAWVGLFTLAGSTDFFLLLRAKQVGVKAEHIPLLWAGLHVIKAGLATPLGAVSDRIGRKRVIVAGWIVYAATYAGFAFVESPWQIYVLFAIYGAHFGLVEGAEKALVAELAPAALRGRAFGAFHFVIGIAALPASLGFGIVWDRASPAAAFLAGGGLALVAALGLTTLAVPPRRAP